MGGLSFSDRVSGLRALPQPDLDALLAKFGVRPVSGGEHGAGGEGGGGEVGKGGEGGGDGKGGESGKGGKSGDGDGGGDGDGDGDDGDGGKFQAITSAQEFDKAIRNRLARQKSTLTKELRTQIEAEIKAEKDRKDAEDQGNYKKLYEDAQTEIERLKGEVTTASRTSLIQKVAAKHRLPSDLAERLQGETEEELEADAKKLAKLVKPADAPETEGGKGSRRGGDGKKPGGGSPPVQFGAPGLKRKAWPGRETGKE